VAGEGIGNIVGTVLKGGYRVKITVGAIVVVVVTVVRLVGLAVTTHAVDAVVKVVGGGRVVAVVVLDGVVTVDSVTTTATFSLSCIYINVNTFVVRVTWHQTHAHTLSECVVRKSSWKRRRRRRRRNEEDAEINNWPIL